MTATWTVSTYAGKTGSIGIVNGSGSTVRFSALNAVALDGSGNLYVVDGFYGTVIRKITPAGAVSTVAGSATATGSADGNGTLASFSSASGLAVDGGGTIYVADTANQTVRKISPLGEVSTFAGTAGVRGHVDATGAAARFDGPRGLAVDASGNLYVAEYGNHCIRRITVEGVVTTFAGSLTGLATITDGATSSAAFHSPWGMALDPAGNLIVADTVNRCIRKVTPAGLVTTLAGSQSISASVDGPGPDARFMLPDGVAVDAAGYVYVVDQAASNIRMITPQGMVTTLAGSTSVYAAVDAVGTDARFSAPMGLAIDATGDLYVTDSNNRTIRKIQR